MEEKTSQKMTGKIRRRRFISVAPVTTMTQCSQMTGFSDCKPELIDWAQSSVPVNSTSALLIAKIWACNWAISWVTSLPFQIPIPPRPRETLTHQLQLLSCLLLPILGSHPGLNMLLLLSFPELPSALSRPFSFFLLKSRWRGCICNSQNYLVWLISPGRSVELRVPNGKILWPNSFFI